MGNWMIKQVPGRFVVIGLLLLAVWFCWLLHEKPVRGCDDANIFFSYAENLAQGNGLTYGHNPERVEGFTSMLWTLLCAASFRAGLGEAGIWALALSLFVGTQFLYLAMIRRFMDGADGPPGGKEGVQFTSWVPAALFLALVLSSPSYVTWTTITLMDTGLWGGCIAWMAFIAIWPPVGRRSLYAALAPFILSPFVRPESMVVAPGFIMIGWLRARGGSVSKTETSPATRFVVSTGLVTAVSWGALTAFRLVYFGFPLPNTYYAKVSPSLLYNLRQGREYLQQYACSGTIAGLGILVVAIAVTLWLVNVIRAGAFRRGWFTGLSNKVDAVDAVALSAALLLVTPVLAGGDYFVMFRFFQPAYPLICLLIVLTGWRFVASGHGSGSLPSQGLGWWSGLRAGAVALIVGYWGIAYAWDLSWSSMRWGSPLTPDFTLVTEGMRKGRLLGAWFGDMPQYPVVGVIAAGGPARTFPGRIVDTMGLNTREFAMARDDREGIRSHTAFNKRIFYTIEPDILLAEPPYKSGVENFDTTVLKRIFYDPPFVLHWRFGVLTRQGYPGVSVRAFFRDRLLDSLALTGTFIFVDEKVWDGKAWVLP